MARKRSLEDGGVMDQDQDGEVVQVLDPSAPAPVPELAPGMSTHPLKVGGEVKASAVSMSDAEKAAKVAVERPVRKFVVTRGGVITIDGFRTRLREGKEIDDLNYDIRKLALQGIHLREVEGATGAAAPIPEGY